MAPQQQALINSFFRPVENRPVASKRRYDEVSVQDEIAPFDEPLVKRVGIIEPVAVVTDPSDEPWMCRTPAFMARSLVASKMPGLWFKSTNEKRNEKYDGIANNPNTFLDGILAHIPDWMTDEARTGSLWQYDE